MEEYVKYFETPDDGDEYVIRDIPWIGMVYSTGQNIVSRSINMLVKNEDDMLELGGSNCALCLLSDGSVVKIDGTIITSEMIAQYKYRLTEVVIGNGVTTIGDSAFYNCPNLTTVTLPDTLTTIGYMAFEDCYNLTSVNIPDSVTTLGNRAFEGCYKLESIHIPYGITTIGKQTFQNCWNLSHVDILDGVETIGESAFNDCKKLTHVIIPDSVTTIEGSAFFDCYDVYIDVPSTVTTIGSHAFYDVLNINYNGTATGYWYERSRNGYVDGLFVYTDNTKTNMFACSKSYDYDIDEPIIIPDTVTSIGSGLCSDFSGFTVVYVPNSVTTIAGDTFGRYTKVIYNGSAIGSPWGAFAVVSSPDIIVTKIDGILTTFDNPDLTYSQRGYQTLYSRESYNVDWGETKEDYLLDTSTTYPRDFDTYYTDCYAQGKDNPEPDEPDEPVEPEEPIEEEQTFTFYVDGEPYEANQGDTWGDWIDSETNGFSTDGSIVYNHETNIVHDSSNNEVNVDDPISDIESYSCWVD